MCFFIVPLVYIMSTGHKMKAVLFFENSELDTWKRLSEELLTCRSMIYLTELGHPKYLFSIIGENGSKRTQHT